MPIFEYSCNGCGRRFERLSFAAGEPACPACGGADLRRLPSSFAVAGGGARAAEPAPGAGGCGSCGDPRGPGACSLD